MSNCPNIFVDTSYLIYYVGFSSWIQYTNNDDSDIEDGFNPIEKNLYVEIFEKTFERKLFNAIHKKVEDIDKRKIVFCFDCKKKNIWRNSFYKEYKEDRKKEVTHKFRWDGIFNYVKKVMIPKYQKQGMKALEMQCTEGDDLIAVCVDYEAKQGAENIVICSDKDLWQLLDRCEIVDLKGKSPDLNISPKKFLLCKILIGDKSDSIPSVFPRCGEKTALKLLENKEKFKEKLKDINIKRNFLMNRSIIDFDFIPQDIKKNIIRNWRILKNEI